MVFLLGFEALFSSALLYSVLVGHNSKTPVPCVGKGTVKLLLGIRKHQFHGAKIFTIFHSTLLLERFYS